MEHVKVVQIRRAGRAGTGWLVYDVFDQNRLVTPTMFGSGRDALQWALDQGYQAGYRGLTYGPHPKRSP